MERIRVVNKECGSLGTQCFIGETQIHQVKSVDFRCSLDEVPVFTFCVVAPPDIDMLADVQFSFAPETIEQACVVLQHELMKYGEFRKAFRDSIASAIDIGNMDDRKKQAEKILQRIAGEA